MSQPNGRPAFAATPAVASFFCVAGGTSRSSLVFKCGKRMDSTASYVAARRFVSSMVGSPPTAKSNRASTDSKAKKGEKKDDSTAPRARREKRASQSRALMAALEKYEPVIGVEVHAQLDTKSKAFCSCSSKSVRTPNTNVCPTCMGHPGALPVLNSKSVQLAAQAAMSLNCIVYPTSGFDRKNYFYSDTSKNYQITQQYHPIAESGCLNLASSGKRIGITRLHMEEDSAKMNHEGDANGRLNQSTHSLVDFNRAGLPLIEIVSEPDIRSGVEAAEYGQELQRILRYIRASDCNMQDGSLRLDVNVSIRPRGESELGTKVELKNLNSFSAVQRSIEYEIERQAVLRDSEHAVVQETRLWDEKENATKLMRVKEEAADYRYFPEPDLPPLVLDDATLSTWRELLPELPSRKRERFVSDLGLSAYDAFLLADDFELAAYFEAAVAAGGDPKLCANWIMGDISKVLNRDKLLIKDCKVIPEMLAELVDLIQDGTISGKIAKDLIIELVLEGGSPAQIVKERNLVSIKDPVEMSEVIVGVMDAHPSEVQAYRDGKKKLFGFFVGKVMAATQGRADPKLTSELLTLNLNP